MITLILEISQMIVGSNECLRLIRRIEKSVRSVRSV